MRCAQVWPTPGPTCSRCNAISARIGERIDETRVQVGREIGKTSRDGDQRVKNLDARPFSKLEEDAKAQAEILKIREAEIQQLKEVAQAAQVSQVAQASAPDGYAEAALGGVGWGATRLESSWRLFERKDFARRPAGFASS